MVGARKRPKPRYRKATVQAGARKLGARRLVHPLRDDGHRKDATGFDGSGALHGHNINNLWRCRLPQAPEGAQRPGTLRTYSERRS